MVFYFYLAVALSLAFFLMGYSVGFSIRRSNKKPEEKKKIFLILISYILLLIFTSILAPYFYFCLFGYCFGILLSFYLGVPQKWPMEKAV
jgi:hypothetical protein